MKKIIYMPLPTVAYFLLSILIERALERSKLDQGFQINNNKAVRIKIAFISGKHQSTCPGNQAIHFSSSSV